MVLVRGCLVANGIYNRQDIHQNIAEQIYGKQLEISVGEGTTSICRYDNCNSQPWDVIMKGEEGTGTNSTSACSTLTNNAAGNTPHITDHTAADAAVEYTTIGKSSILTDKPTTSTDYAGSCARRSLIEKQLAGIIIIIIIYCFLWRLSSNILPYIITCMIATYGIQKLWFVF